MKYSLLIIGTSSKHRLLAANFDRRMAFRAAAIIVLAISESDFLYTHPNIYHFQDKCELSERISHGSLDSVTMSEASGLIE